MSTAIPWCYYFKYNILINSMYDLDREQVKRMPFKHCFSKSGSE